MSKRESLGEFLKNITGKEDIHEAKEYLTGYLETAKMREIALTNMGLLTISVIPGGAFAWSLSENLQNRVALDSVDKALNDIQEEIIQLRRQLTDNEIKAAAQQIKKQQEEPDGSNSIDSSGHRENRA